MPPPRWLVDEMLGRLARYLRFVGCDTEYARDTDDDRILERAEREDRVLLTRDRALSRRSRRALLIESSVLEEQWRAVRAAWPTLPDRVVLERCTLCNGVLAPVPPGAPLPSQPGVPQDRVARGLELFACARCGHLYWEGSHTARIRAQIARWGAERGR